MTDVAYLGIDVDSRGAVRAQRDLRGLEGQAGRTEGATRRMGGSARAAVAGFVSLTAAAAALTRTISASQKYVRMTNSLRALGMSSTQAAATLDQVAAVAQRTRAPLDATAQLYQRVSIAGRDLGASSQDVLRFTENVSLALAQTGGSASSASGALLQLSQAMSGGVVRAEEFNSILEGAFPIAQAAANAIEGAAGSVGQLRNMVIAGEVSSREFFDAIISQTAELEEAFANTTPTIGQAMTVLGDSFTIAAGKMDAVLGISDAIANVTLLLANNLEVIPGIIISAAGALATYYAPAMYAAITATGGLTAALGLLKTALVATGIGALVVGAGILIGKFIQLSKAAGGFGEAFNLVKDVAEEIFGRIPEFVDVAVARMGSDWLDFKAATLEVFAGIVEYVAGDWVNNLIGGMVGAKDAVAAVWDVLPDVFKNVGARAVNGLIEMVGKGVEKLVTGPMAPLLRLAGINPAAAGLGAGAISQMQIDVPAAPNVGGAVSDAFSAAMGRDYVGGFTSGVSDTASRLRAEAEIVNNVANLLAENMKRPIESLGAMRDVMAEVAEETGMTTQEVEAIAAAMNGGGGGEGAAGGAAGAAERLAQSLTPIQEKMRGLGQSIAGYVEEPLMALVDGTKNAADAFRSMAANIIKELYRIFVVKKITGFIEGAIGGMFGGGGSNGLSLPGAITSAIRSFDGGGYTGNGPRAGGLDGQGGFMAMLHPRETVVDHTKGDSGGVVVNQTINVSTGVAQTVRSEIRQMMPQIADSAKAAVADAKLRGGSYGRAF